MEDFAATNAEEVRRAIGASERPKHSRFMRVLLIGAVLASCVAAVVWGIRRHAATTLPAYETALVSRGDVRVTVIATGALEAITTVEVGAEVTGRLLSVLVGMNDPVKKGQLLAVIDPEQLRAAADESLAQVASAEAAIRVAKATLVEAGQTATRVAEQAKQGLVSQKDLESATAANERARANVASSAASAELARATLNQALSRLNKTKIISPIDGIVLSRRVEPGQTLTAGFQTPILFRLAQDLVQMRLNVDIDEADMGRVHEGLEATFTVDAYPDRTFSSRVTSLCNEPKKSQNVVTYQAVLSVDNQERLLRPGMTCTATILANTRKDVLVVPNAALRFVPPAANDSQAPKTVGAGDITKKQQRVWVLRGATPTPINVRAGATNGSIREIVDGAISPGERVIVELKPTE